MFIIYVDYIANLVKLKSSWDFVCSPYFDNAVEICSTKLVTVINLMKKSPACNKVSYYFLNTGSAYLFFIMLVSFFTLLYSILCRPWKFNRTLSYLTSQLRFEMLITKTFMLLIEHAFKNPFRGGGGWIVTMLPPEYRRCNMQQSTVIVYSISSKS